MSADRREDFCRGFAVKQKQGYGYEVFIDGECVPWHVVDHLDVQQTEVEELSFVTLTLMVEGAIDIDPSLDITQLGEGAYRVSPVRWRP